MSENENVELGYAMDPNVIYGGSLHQQTANRMDGGDSARIIEDSPPDGPQSVTDQATSPGVLGFLKSPAGALVILLPLAYWLFNEVYA